MSREFAFAQFHSAGRWHNHATSGRDDESDVGGAVGPLVGWMKDFTGSYSGGLYGLAVFTGVSTLIAAFALHIPRQVPMRHGVGVPAE